MADSRKSFFNATLSTAALGAAGYAFYRFARRALTEYTFAGKTVVITGGSRGLGLTLARQLAAEGANVAIIARDQQQLEKAQGQIAREYGVSGSDKVMAVSCDITKEQDVVAAVGLIYERFKGIDVLVNDAGIIRVTPYENATRKDFEELMNVYFWGALNMIQTCLPHLKRSPGGRIINITSVGGLIAAPHLIPYAAGKFALVGLSEGLYAELAKDGIKVTTVAPGMMRTGSIAHAEFKGHFAHEFSWFSVAANLPFISLDVERAAGKIIQASREGRAYLIMPWTTRVAVSFHSLFPGLSAQILRLVNRLMPGPTGNSNRVHEGHEIPLGPTQMTLSRPSLGAAIKNNEL